MDHNADAIDAYADLTAPATPAAVAPLADAERIASLDVLRGVAVLGILAMNISMMSAPFIAYGNPHWAGGESRTDFFVWLFNHIIFDAKMMSIFSMLFGAGILVFTQRAEKRRPSAAGLYYRRMGLLLVLGLIHAYFIWVGDILVAYALCGMMLYPLRRMSPGRQIALGVALMLVATPIGLLQGWGIGYMRDAATEATAALDAGEELSEDQRAAIEAWEEPSAFFDPSPDDIERELAAHRGGWAGITVYRAPMALSFQTFYFITWGMWRAGGMMLVGMGLYKLGVLSARRSSRFYALGALAGYAAGLPVIAVGAQRIIAHDFDMVAAFLMDYQFNYVGSMAVAFAHVCVVMLVCRSGALAGARRTLAAVGRMALTNYLMQSVIATTIFYGYGFGLFGSVDRLGMMATVAGVWTAQLIYSPIWLRSFRFGPAEWLWRSATYGKPQPMRRE